MANDSEELQRQGVKLESLERRVSFKNRSIDIAGNIHFPNGFDEKKTYPALVIATPGSSDVPPCMLRIPSTGGAKFVRARQSEPRQSQGSLLTGASIPRRIGETDVLRPPS